MFINTKLNKPFITLKLEIKRLIINVVFDDVDEILNTMHFALKFVKVYTLTTTHIYIEIPNKLNLRLSQYFGDYNPHNNSFSAFTYDRICNFTFSVVLPHEISNYWALIFFYTNYCQNGKNKY